MGRIDVGKPVTTQLKARHWLAPGILELQLGRPVGFNFIPGQFLRLMMGDYQRDYTMVSAPGSETIDLCIALQAGGRFSGEIQKADIGATLLLTGPHGHFIFQGPVNPAVFVATGTGVAPFVAFCRSGVANALLLHGVSTPDRLIYQDTLKSALRGYLPCISRFTDDADSLENPFAGRVTHYLAQELKPGRYDFYLCGRRSMIRDVTAIIDERFGDSRLFIEAYD